jgi:hypothetical protein
MDVGWTGQTFCIWGAHDSRQDIVYLTGEYSRSMVEPPVHQAAVSAREPKIPIFIDPASNASSQFDGRRLFEAKPYWAELDGVDVHRIKGPQKTCSHSTKRSKLWPFGNSRSPPISSFG